MTLVDTDIRKLISDGILAAGDDTLSAKAMAGSVHAISYDLHTRSFVNNETVNMDECRLAPGESVFVSTKEIVHLPNDLIARIVIRNSRLRQGLSLEAPVYQPGHETRIFFRLTNVNNKAVDLGIHSGYAAVMFERLDNAPEKPYSGEFQNEMAYSDMAGYTAKYKEELVNIDGKIDEIKHLEKNIYTNTITWMSIFIALFSLINVNVDLAFAQDVDQLRLIVSNLVTVGSISFLVSLIQLCFAHNKRTYGIWGVLLAVSLVVLVFAVMLVLQ